jgi:hypothetical protein
MTAQPWIADLFGVEKPVIAMAHLPALPGTPRYDEHGGMARLVEWVQADVAILEAGGVDAVLFCNEDDRPYVLEAGIEQVAAMARVIADTRPQRIPFGADFMWDPLAAIAIAHATGARFIREVLSGAYESDMGLWSPDAGRAARFRRSIGAQGVRMFFNVVPEFASPLGRRTAAQRARSAAVSSLADVILVSGPMAGAETDLSTVQAVKAAVGDTPVFVNTGVKPENVAECLRIADGVIVGSSLKVDGITWNPVDPARLARFMDHVGRARGSVSP